MKCLCLAALAIVPASWAAVDSLAQGKQAYQRSDFKQATRAFEQAAEAEPANAQVQHWLGKAYGRLAETSSFLNAPRYASKCRQAFEKAVQLDPKLTEAWSDLFAYYLEAPGFLGGGVDKAERAAATIARLHAVEGHFAQAELAKKRKDFATAERELRRAAELAPNDIGRQIDLAVYLAGRGQAAPSDAAFEQARALDGDHPRYLFERGKALAKRNAAEARRLLERYLQLKLGPDDAPASEARKLLGDLK